MDFRSLRFFLSIVDRGSFRAASVVHNITQPALTQRIQRLERELGFALFDRSRQRTTLTTQGAQFLPHVRQILNEAERGLEAAARIGAGMEGELRLGFTLIASLSVVPALIRQFTGICPAVNLTLIEAPSHELERMVADGRLDAALVHPPVWQPRLRTIAIADESYIAALPTTCCDDTQSAVSLHTLADIGLIIGSREVGPAIYDRTLGTFQAQGIVPRINRTANTSTALLSLVAAGLGAALIVAPMRAIQLYGVTFRPLDKVTLSLPTALIIKPEQKSHVVSHLLTATQTIAKNHKQYG